MSKLKLILGISCLFIPALLIAQNWQSLGTGSNHAVRCMFADTINNKLYVGKDAMSQGQNGLNVWNGSDWDTLRNVCTPVYSINKFQNNIIVASACGIQVWNGSNFTLIGSGAIGLYNDNNNYLYATGGFDTIGGVPASKVAKWNGTSWSAIDTTHWEGGLIDCSIIYNGELYIGGNFWNSTGTISRIAKWNGTQWLPLNNGIIGGVEDVLCFEIHNNELYVGGYFSTSNGNPGNCIAKWNGTQWSDVGGGMTTTNAYVNDIKIYNNQLYASGIYTVAGGVPINYIAKWDGIDWCGLGFDFSNIAVLAMSVLNNELYIGGGFQTINGNTMNYVSKWVGGNYVDNCGNTTGIEQLNVNETLNIYPNPSQSQITIEFDLTETKNVSIEIENILGQTVQTIDSRAFSNGKNKIEIDVSEFSKGLYFMQLQSENKIISKKFVKE